MKALKIAVLAAPVLLVGCSTTPPAEPDNLCAIFEEKRDWYQSAKKTRDKWGVPIQVPMAMMYQESSFRHDARPPRNYVFFGLVPWGHVSTAYGYSQAKTVTWGDYKKATGNRRANRENFDDAMDFMGWYIYRSNRINGVSKWDAYGQYLNYHEGWGGYKHKSYNKKPWLIKVSRTVEKRASRYGAQLKQCEDDLNKGWFSRMFS